MLAPPKRQSAEGSVHSEPGTAPDSASLQRAPAQIESFRDAMPRDSSLGIQFNKFFSTYGKYDSVIYGRALSQTMRLCSFARLRDRDRAAIYRASLLHGVAVLDAVDGGDRSHQSVLPNTVTHRRRRISIPCRRYSAMAESLSENTCRNGISPRARIWRDTAASNICA